MNLITAFALGKAVSTMENIQQFPQTEMMVELLNYLQPTNIATSVKEKKKPGSKRKSSPRTLGTAPMVNTSEMEENKENQKPEISGKPVKRRMITIKRKSPQPQKSIIQEAVNLANIQHVTKDTAYRYPEVTCGGYVNGQYEVEEDGQLKEVVYKQSFVQNGM